MYKLLHFVCSTTLNAAEKTSIWLKKSSCNSLHFLCWTPLKQLRDYVNSSKQMLATQITVLLLGLTRIIPSNGRSLQSPCIIAVDIGRVPPWDTRLKWAWLDPMRLTTFSRNGRATKDRRTGHVSSRKTWTLYIWRRHFRFTIWSNCTAHCERFSASNVTV